MPMTARNGRDPIKQRECEQRYRDANRAALKERARQDRLTRGTEINAARRKRYWELKHCRECGRSFTPTGGRSAYCDPRCRRTAYIREHPNYQRSPCMDCGKMISSTAERCRACGGIARRGKPLATREPVNASCPYCSVDMRLVPWHGRIYWHCPACGLETTAAEVRRFALEQEIAA